MSIKVPIPNPNIGQDKSRAGLAIVEVKGIINLMSTYQGKTGFNKNTKTQKECTCS